MARIESCDDCGNPCLVSLGGWYRCRQCGYESLRSVPVRSTVDGYVDFMASSIDESGEAAGLVSLFDKS